MNTVEFITAMDAGIFFNNRQVQSPIMKQLVEITNSILNGCSCHVKGALQSLERVYSSLPQLTEEEKQNLKEVAGVSGITFSNGSNVIISF